jgi:hypothetical protein
LLEWLKSEAETCLSELGSMNYQFLLLEYETYSFEPKAYLKSRDLLVLFGPEKLSKEHFTEPDITLAKFWFDFYLLYYVLYYHFL